MLWYFVEDKILWTLTEVLAKMQTHSLLSLMCFLAKHSLESIKSYLPFTNMTQLLNITKQLVGTLIKSSLNPYIFFLS